MAATRCLAVVAVLTAGCAAAGGGPPAGPAASVCKRAAAAPKIDGVADDPAWADAPKVTDFRAGWANRPAKSPTEARLLWDDAAVYFTATMKDADLYADVAQRNGQTWNNDVFELFFKPSIDRRGYYEFQVNALNTPFEMYLPSRGSGAFLRFHASQKPMGLTSAVKLRGTLNDYADADEGWTVEGLIPWSAFAPTGGRPKPGDVWKFALCRYDYSVAYDDPDLSSSAALTQPNFHRFEDYGDLRFAGPVSP